MKLDNPNCIPRLHQYRNTLYRLKQMGFVKVFSDNLSDAVGVTASQVRRDFSDYGLTSGNKRGGYQIENLISRLNEILGKNELRKVIVAGAGNIGKALMGYKGFEKEGIRIVAAFDSDASRLAAEAEVPVLPLEELEAYIRKHKIEVGIIAVPDFAAQGVLDRMVKAGIKGALNFAPIRLNIPENFIMDTVNVGVKLETVLYSVSALNRKNSK